MKKLTIVTITFNNYEELTASVESYKPLLTDPNFEAFIVNGGKCEKTQAFLTVQASPNFRFISEPDKGISDAFSKGAQHAAGQYVAFLNSGDKLLDSSYYTDAIAFLESNPMYDFAFSNLVFEDAQIGNSITYARPENQMDLARGMPFPHPTMIVKRALFEKVGYFDLNFKIGMDYEWVCRILKIGAKGYYFNRQTVLMDGKGVSSKNEGRGLEETYKALKKNDLLTLKNLAILKSRKFQHFVKRSLMNSGLERLVVLLRKFKRL